MILYSDLPRGLKNIICNRLIFLVGREGTVTLLPDSLYSCQWHTGLMPATNSEVYGLLLCREKHTLHNVWIMTPKKSFSGQKKQHQETKDLKLNEQEVSRPKVQCTLASGQGIWSFQGPHLQTQDQLALCHGRASWAFSGSKDSLLRWEFYHRVGHPLVQEPSKVVHFRKWGAQLENNVKREGVLED